MLLYIPFSLLWEEEGKGLGLNYDLCFMGKAYKAKGGCHTVSEPPNSLRDAVKKS